MCPVHEFFRSNLLNNIKKSLNIIYLVITILVVSSTIILVGCSEDTNNGTAPPPTNFNIIVTYPVNGATGVELNTVISIKFSEAPDTNTIDTNTFIIDSSLTGTFSHDNLWLIFTPDTDLDSNKTYVFKITRGVTNIMGESLQSEYTLIFTTTVSPNEGGIAPELFIFAPTDNMNSPQLLFQVKNPFSLLRAAVYTPRASWPPPFGENLPIPLLILLAPQNGDEFYYFNYGLKEIADALIADSTIIPMAVCCLGNDEVFGGVFYSNSYPAGFYDDIIGSLEAFRLLDQLYANFPFLINASDKRGIGGIGQGAYGAFRACLKNPGIFTSITAIDGPLDFDGPSGSSGFIELFDDVLIEQGLLNDDSFRHKFDSSSNKPLSNIFIGASLSFSPHDTLIEWEYTTPPQININNRYQLDDTTTLVSHIIGADDHHQHFHLPFTCNGTAYQPIWENFWLPNNLENILNVSDNQLNGVNIWIGTCDNAPFGYYEQTRSWITTLTSVNYAYPVDTVGYDCTEPESSKIRRQIADMLIFHSNLFTD
ncbi:MAG: Ig-like domain-containing protein [candidate division Zixibacteria bacterium]|nr:Ig-like domain-containing protein [candidate division Zixibacteria bacterium]